MHTNGGGKRYFMRFCLAEAEAPKAGLRNMSKLAHQFLLGWTQFSRTLTLSITVACWGLPDVCVGEIEDGLIDF